MKLRGGLAVGFWMVASAASAQSWTACVDPTTDRLTADGHRAVREAAGALGEPRRFLTYHIRRATKTGAQSEPPFRTPQLEMMYVGINPGSISWDEGTPYTDPPVAEQACFEISAREGPPGLWHYWGPYFAPGSAVIPEAQKPDLEYLIARYQPGRTVFRVYAYADTAGSSEQNDRISAARAEAVARELVRFGVRWDDIEQSSFGETNLARPTADGVAEPLNRRAQIDVRLRPEPAR